MPTKNYESMHEAYKSLTDIEIEDDSKNYPVAVIDVPGIQKISITMLSEYNYWYVFLPMRNRFINYYATKFVNEENETRNEKIIEKIKAFQNDISSYGSDEKSIKTLQSLFSEVDERKYFFKCLKKMGVIKWWVSWKRWQLRARPIDTITIFVFLWLFNVDGLKKNAKFLIDQMSQAMNTRLPIESKIFENLDSFKVAHQKAHERFMANSNN